MIAVVPQELNVVFSFTVMQMVLMGGSVRYGFSGIPGKKEYLYAFEILEELNIEILQTGGLMNFRRRKTGGADSTSLFQKAEISCLMSRHLTSTLSASIYNGNDKKISEEKGLQLLSHFMIEYTGRYCNKLIMLNRGCVCHQGSREKIFDVESLESVYEMKIKIERTDTGADYVTPILSRGKMKKISPFIIITVLLMAGIIFALTVGQYHIKPETLREIIMSKFSGKTAGDDLETPAMVLWSVRLPRVTMHYLREPRFQLVELFSGDNEKSPCITFISWCYTWSCIRAIHCYNICQ